MSETNEHTEQQAGIELLTPKAAAITAFTFAVLALSGQNAWTAAVQSFFGTSFGTEDYGRVVAFGAVAAMLLAFGAVLLARRVIQPPGAGQGWEQHLARAAVMVAGFAALCAALTAIGGFVGGP